MTRYFSCQTPLYTASELNSTKLVSIDEANMVPETRVIYASAKSEGLWDVNSAIGKVGRHFPNQAALTALSPQPNDMISNVL
ncbi:hypothetical protein RHMOL_Rhmol09G0173300 [Rhododendron molle]|uniref:Uncharacterized protein n=1 Tax=Rhododendron molle TaxID=49168 RepID=A0ACC0MG84_RHOML|nr:hypothetical protein RHMOL_Rhmol09G0173300 [Rhododendron molle]